MLEDGAQFQATQAAIREREVEFLDQLKEIKESMAKEQQEKSDSGGGSGASSEKVKALQEENQTLKAKLAKNEYRVRHLIEGMEELLAAKAKAK